MPVVAIIDGVKIEFYPDEHPPPHFHARYAEFVAQNRHSNQQDFARFAASREARSCANVVSRTQGRIDECMVSSGRNALTGEDR